MESSQHGVGEKYNSWTKLGKVCRFGYVPRQWEEGEDC